MWFFQKKQLMLYNPYIDEDIPANQGWNWILYHLEKPKCEIPVIAPKGENLGVAARISPTLAEALPW